MKDENKDGIVSRIKRIAPARIKKPVGWSIEYMLDIGRLPRDAIGALRNRNAVFLWIPKTGGGTLHKALDAQICSKFLNLASAERRFLNKGLVTFGHMDYAQLVQSGLVRSRFNDSAYKFCFSRNPYSRAVSLFFFLKKRRWTEENLSFLDFCRRVEGGVDDIGLFNVRGLSFCNPQTRWLQGVMPDFVGKLENIEIDGRHVFESLGLSVPDRFSPVNTTKHSPYCDYYCSESRDIVSRFYRSDFERFGYSLDM